MVSKYPEYRILRGGQDAGLPWGRLGWGVGYGEALWGWVGHRALALLQWLGEQTTGLHWGVL